jgi:hypothetical protein
VRFRHVVAIVVVTVAASLTGQEEPLPVVTPHVGVQIAFSTEPILDPPKPTLAGAAHANDFATFDALYRDAQRRGENVAAFAMLHDLWTYSINDPIGAFYGERMHDLLSRAYPGYAAFIEDQRIVDDRGNVFYPSSETRAFLLARAEAGDVVPSLPPVRVASRRTTATPATTPAARPARRPVHRKPVVKPAAAASAPAPAPASAPVPAPPVVITLAPAPVVVEKTAEKTAAPAPVPEKPAPVVSQSRVQPVAQPQVQPRPQAQARSGADRGLLLVIVGLIGIGLLALILRAPREEMPSVITPQPPHEDHPKPL